jgi:hypothetical protein
MTDDTKDPTTEKPEKAEKKKAKARSVVGQVIERGGLLR